jgi:hypothetical protein
MSTIVDQHGRVVVFAEGDILTTDKGLLGFGHAAIIRMASPHEGVYEVLDNPPLLYPDVPPDAGDVCVGIHRSLDNFISDPNYVREGRTISLSTPIKSDGLTDTDWKTKKANVTDAIKTIAEQITCYSKVEFALDILFDLKNVWYCSEIIYRKYWDQGIDLVPATDKAPIFGPKGQVLYGEALRALIARQKNIGTAIKNYSVDGDVSDIVPKQIVSPADRLSVLSRMIDMDKDQSLQEHYAAWATSLLIVTPENLRTSPNVTTIEIYLEA